MCERLIGDLKRSKDIDEAAEDKVLSWFFCILYLFTITNKCIIRLFSNEFERNN